MKKVTKLKPKIIKTFLHVQQFDLEIIGQAKVSIKILHLQTREMKPFVIKMMNR